jgi:hypothetical protein
MRTLHIAPGDSAGGSLIRAVRDAGRDDEVLPFLDDLSCGPIKSDEPSVRAMWWARFYEASEVDATLRRFWDRVDATDDRLVVWFGRHSAREVAFFLAWADRLGDRTYSIIDVTGRRLPVRRRDGSVTLSRPVQSVSILQADALKLLLGQEQPVAAQDRDESRRHWRRLRDQNAPFRIVTEAGLVSTSVDHSDPLLLARTAPEWQTVACVISDTIGYNSESYFQIGDLMLQARVAALVDEGRLIADGDPWKMASRIRLPG